MWGNLMSVIGAGAYLLGSSLLKKDPDRERLSILRDELRSVLTSQAHWTRMQSAYARKVSDPAFLSLSAEEREVAFFGEVARAYEAEGREYEAEIKLLVAQIEEKDKAAFAKATERRRVVSAEEEEIVKMFRTLSDDAIDRVVKQCREIVAQRASGRSEAPPEDK